MLFRSVIEEYVRPSRVVEHGRVVVKEALSEPELVTIPGLGTLEAFYTDGLRSLADTHGATPLIEFQPPVPYQAALQEMLSVDGLLVLDLPPEEADDYERLMAEAGLCPIWLVAPTTPDERIARIADRKSTRLNSSHIPLSRMPSSA